MNYVGVQVAPTFVTNICACMAQWVSRLATDPVVKGSSHARGHIPYALLINNQNKLNLLSWLLVYLHNK